MQQFGTGVTPFGLNLDFNPIIQKFNLSGIYSLQHWQAKPRGHRNFGYLLVKGDTSEYKTIAWSEIVIEVFPQTLQVDETKVTTLPTAVNYFPGGYLKWSKEYGKWLLTN